MAHTILNQSERSVRMEINSLDNYLTLAEEELLMYVKDFEEQKSRKRAQEKENVHHKHEISMKAELCIGNSRKKQIK